MAQNLQIDLVDAVMFTQFSLLYVQLYLSVTYTYMIANNIN